MENVPIEIIKQIKEYIPRDKDMKSQTSGCIRHLIRLYNYVGDNAICIYTYLYIYIYM